MSKPYSVIIISYNRPDEFETVLNNLLDQGGAEELIEDIVIINNGSNVSYQPVIDLIDRLNPTTAVDLRYIDAGENLGVAGGRNRGVELARGDRLLFIDDDAWFTTTDALRTIDAKFTAHPEVALIAFEIRETGTGAVLTCHKRPDIAARHEFKTWYFIGAGHVWKRDAIEEGTLPYDASFFYGQEEWDLSYEVVRRGGEILCTRDISVWHKVNPSGRSAPERVTALKTINRWKVVHKYLPWRFVWSQYLMWSLFYLRNTGFDVAGLIRLIRRYRRELDRSMRTRHRLGPDAMAYLRRVKARLTY